MAELVASCSACLTSHEWGLGEVVVGLLYLPLHGSTAPPPSSYQESEREGEGEGDDAKKKMGEQIWRKSTWICYRRWRRRRWSLERRRGDDRSKLAAAVLLRIVKRELLTPLMPIPNPLQPVLFVNPTRPDP